MADPESPAAPALDGRMTSEARGLDAERLQLGFRELNLCDSGIPIGLKSCIG